MKKKCFVLITVLLILSLIAPQSAFFINASAEEWYEYGDANMDGVVNIDDAILVAKVAGYIAPPLSGNAFKYADVEKLDSTGKPLGTDGRITAADVRAILRHISGVQPINSGSDPNLTARTKPMVAQALNTAANAVKTSSKEPMIEIGFEANLSSQVTAVSYDVKVKNPFNLLAQGIAVDIRNMMKEVRTEMLADGNTQESFNVLIPNLLSSVKKKFPVENENVSMNLLPEMINTFNYSYDKTAKTQTYNVTLVNEVINLNNPALTDPFTQTNHGKVFLVPGIDDLGDISSLANTDGMVLNRFDVTYKDCKVTYVVDSANAAHPLSAYYEDNYTLTVQLDMMDAIVITFAVSSKNISSYTFEY